MSALALALAPSGARAADDPGDAEVTREARLPTILRLALERNPEIGGVRARADAAGARARAASRLPDPELKYEQWGVPLARPYALDHADTLMLGVRQAFPAWGTRAARARMAEEEAGGAEAEARQRRLEVVADVRRAFADYARAHHELALHRDHADLTSRLGELARRNYQTGRGTQQDVLRLALELSRLHADVARIDEEKRASRALLNALMGRPPGAHLGPPPPLEAPAPAPAMDELDRGIEGRRPEVASSARAVRREQAALDLARRSARYPTVMVGLDYWYMPMLEERHGYGAMVSVSLPWLVGRRRDEVAEAEHRLRAGERALEATRLEVRRELEDAAAQADGARARFDIVDRDLLPQAERSLQAVQAAFAAGQGDGLGLLDALRSYLQVRVERVRALARLHASLAELERAAGREDRP